MIKSYSKLISFGLMAYILVVFLALNTEWAGYILLAGIYALYFMYPGINNKIMLPNKIMFALMIVLVCFLLSLVFCEYSQLYTVASFGCLMLMYLLNEKGMLTNALEINTRIDWFYILVFILTCVRIALSYRSLSDTSLIAFNTIGDANYTGVFVFCVFLYANKRKYISGVILAIAYAIFFTQSRSFILLLLLFYIIKYLPDKNKSFIDKHKKPLFLLFVLLFAAVAIFSVIWVYYISVNGLAAYKEGLNDGSNRMRFVSNIKAFSMLSDPRNTLLWGYGDKLLDVMGISSTQWELNAKYLGVRLVQPHNSLINPLVRMGIIPGVVYWYILSLTLDKLNTKENMEYMFPYMINGMVMHSLFGLQWLVLWVLILALPQTEKKRKVVFTYGKRTKER